jgi:hypothetical protein
LFNRFIAAVSAHRLFLELALCSQKISKTILIVSLFKSSGAPECFSSHAFFPSQFYGGLINLMGHDAMSVVDGSLKVHGIDKLRIADGSIMPRVTTGNTMAPCVVIGERAAEILEARHSV